MDTLMRTVGAVVLLVGISAVMPALVDAQDRTLGPSVTVMGSGNAAARPDTAHVTTGVVTQAASAADAVRSNNTAVEKLLKVLADLKIAEKDIQTAEFSVTPRYRRDPQEPRSPEIVGYEVSNRLRVTVRDLAILGRLLDELIAQGSNTVHGIRFSVAEPIEVMDQARVRAVADARRKAELYATAAEVTLGRVLVIQEASAVVPLPPVVGLQREMAASAVPVAAGEQEFQVTVTVTYAIQ